MKLKMLAANSDFIDQFKQVSSDGRLTISAAVGAGSPPRVRNIKIDTEKIQSALNRFEPIDGGPFEKLVVDGIVGPKTRAAIKRFQEKRSLAKRVNNVPVGDGIVDVDGITIAVLRAGPDVLPPADSFDRFEEQSPRVKAIIVTAEAALSVASARLSLPNGTSGASAFSALDKHFHTRTNGERQATINLVQRVFTTMKAAIGFIPQGRVLAADEPADFIEGSLMFTFAGGFNLPIDPDTKKTPTFKNLPVDRIYICPAGRQLGTEQFQYGMIHELAHFISDTKNIPDIDDQAYFHRNRAKYDQLSNFLALRNADSYARFAFETIGKGNIIIPK